LTLLYACDLRIAEAARLKVGAIDSADHLLRIIGKGDKERPFNADCHRARGARPASRISPGASRPSRNLVSPAFWYRRTP
jgi:hypothetical protein